VVDRGREGREPPIQRPQAGQARHDEHEAEHDGTAQVGQGQAPGLPPPDAVLEDVQQEHRHHAVDGGELDEDPDRHRQAGQAPPLAQREP
jgi:hypothetical protein